MSAKVMVFVSLLALAGLLMLVATGTLPNLFSGESGQSIPGTISEGTRVVRGVPGAIGEGGAVLLLTGGLLILLLMLPLTLLRSIHEEAQREVVHPNGGKTPATSKYELGFKMGSSLNAQHVDEIAEGLEHLEDANVAILNTNEKTTKIRIKNCKSCNHPVCEFEKGFCAGAFGQLHGAVEVDETKCQATGSQFCEFEVKRRR